MDSLLIAIKKRVNVAREIDKCQLQCHREKFQKGWLQRTANEMDILLDDEAL
jgi:ATP-dependent RNA helicase DDX24/MAK5